MAKQINIAQAPELRGIPRVDFLTPDFDTLVWNKGYNVLLEEAIPCPCGMKVTAAQSACQNCLGRGWIFISPTETKAVIQNINRSTKYKDWSAELLGTINITIENRFQLSYMDRITIVDSITVNSEVQLVRSYDDKLFIYSIYPIITLSSLFKFVSSTEKLQKIENYTVEENKIFLDESEVKAGDSISIRYKHNIQYNIIDINHDVRNTYELNNKSREDQINLPVSAIARKVHYVFDAKNLNGESVFDNG